MHARPVYTIAPYENASCVAELFNFSDLKFWDGIQESKESLLYQFGTLGQSSRAQAGFYCSKGRGLYFRVFRSLVCPEAATKVFSHRMRRLGAGMVWSSQTISKHICRRCCLIATSLSSSGIGVLYCISLNVERHIHQSHNI